MAGGGTSDGEFGFQIAPMLDILFVLLLFFMVSAGAQKHEASLTTELPGPTQSPLQNVSVQIGIDSDGQVDINGQPVDAPNNPALPELLGRLNGLMQDSADRPVVITPSRSTKHKRVMDVLNACAGAKVKNLAFGTPSD